MEITVFFNATDEACPVCLRLYHNGKIPREGIMPIPKAGPRTVTGERCCYDCQSAENLSKFIPTISDFNMARIAVLNDRMESLRMPKGMGKHYGLMKAGYMKIAHIGQLDPHLTWLDTIGDAL